MTYFITTTSPFRLREWENTFGTTVLPVINDRPITLRVSKGVKRQVYVLDATELTTMQRARLAARIKSECRVPYEVALGMVTDGWTIAAENCELVTEEQSPAFLFPVSRLPFRKATPFFRRSRLVFA